jgi:hypothetical protein
MIESGETVGYWQENPEVLDKNVSHSSHIQKYNMEELGIFFFPSIHFVLLNPSVTLRSILLSLYNKHNTNIHVPRRDSNPQSQ